jgi:hypothetical protein
MTPSEVLRVACPRCQAAIGVPCIALGRRVAAHPMRVTQAELAAHWQAGAGPRHRPDRWRWPRSRYG